MSLAKISVERPIAVMMFYVGIILIGIISLARLPVALMPDVSYKKITIITRVRGGMPPTEVEELVTRPIEDAVSLVGRIEDITSRSEKGESQVVIRFEPGTDMDFAALEVREKFTRVKNKLPKEIERPVIARYEETDAYVLIAATKSDKYTTEYLRKVIDEDIKEYLLRIDGVANVDVYGGRERKILVEFDQAKLNAYNISILSAIDMLGLNNLNLLAGNVEGKRNKYMLRTIGAYKSVEEIRNVPMAVSGVGSLIKLKDIASVEDSFIEPENYARLSMKPEKFPSDVVSLYVHKESTANTIKVVDEIKKQIDGPIREKLAKLGLVLGKDLSIDIISDQADFIKKAIKTVRNALLQGAVLAALLLFYYLRDKRSTFIICASIPISVIATFALMFLRNTFFPQEPISINVMTLSGLALGIGMLVDNSIVVIENIFSKREKKMSPKEAAITGTNEVFIAIVASTLTTIIVFFPIVFVTEEVKMLYGELALTVTFSLLASLLVALTLVPSLAAMSKREVPKGIDIKKSKRIYRKWLAVIIRKRYLAVSIAVIIFAVSLFVFKHLDREFMGQTEQGKFTIFARLEAGAKLDASDEMVKEIEDVISLNQAVKNFSSRIEGWSSRIYVSLLPFSETRQKTEDVIEWLRPRMKEIERKYRGGFVYFSEIQSPGMPEISLDVYGHNYDKLNELIAGLGQGIQSVPGMVDLKRSIEPGRPEFRIIIDKEKAAYYGMTTQEIADILHAETRGLRATLFHTEGSEVEIIGRLEEDYRKTFEDIRNLLLTTPKGDIIRLKQVARFEPAIGPSEIHRKNKNRFMELSGTSTSLSQSRAIQTIKKALKSFKMPRDYYWEFGGDYEKQVQNQKQLTLVLLLTVILVYMVMASLFESYYQPLIIMITIPLAYVGAVFILWLFKIAVGIGVLIGAIMLGGIVVNNAIVLVDKINAIRAENRSVIRAVISGGNDRLRPILLTTGTTVLGLMPMIFDRSEASNLWSPLAVTVTAGLICSTILTLILIPSIYIIFEDIRGSFQRRTFFADIKLLVKLLRSEAAVVKVAIKRFIKRQE
ncbi:MAG: efflux RND transporter permease subunit [Candidatus Omnitrophica bacterium]|nr:efflux RND transporter permease subunit [Candidatus Omnitrophota bacterium]